MFIIKGNIIIINIIGGPLNRGFTVLLMKYEMNHM